MLRGISSRQVLGAADVWDEQGEGGDHWVGTAAVWDQRGSGQESLAGYHW